MTDRAREQEKASEPDEDMQRILNPHHPRVPQALPCGCCAECGCFCGGAARDFRISPDPREDEF